LFVCGRPKAFPPPRQEPGCARLRSVHPPAGGRVLQGGAPQGRGDWKRLLRSLYPLPTPKASMPHSKAGGRYFFGGKKVSKKPPLIPGQRTHGLRGL